MKQAIRKTSAFFAVSAAVAAMASDNVYELEPADDSRGAWRISAGVRTAPGVKTKASVNGAAAVSAAGRVQPPAMGGNPSKGGMTSSSSASTKTSDAGSSSTGTTRTDAEAASGYRNGATRYDFDNGYIDMEDAAGIAGETTNWHFDDAAAFDGAGCTISGTIDYESTTKSKSTTTTTTTTTETETLCGRSGVSVSETFFDNPSDSGRETHVGFEIQAARRVWENRSFGVEVAAGVAIYDDVECFKAGGCVYAGRATTTRGDIKRTTTETVATRTSETTVTTTESGSIATVIFQPEFTDLSDIQNPDGSIGGASYDGLPSQPGWGTPVLTVDPGRFSVEDHPNGAETVSTTTAGDERTETRVSTLRTPGASATASRTIDVRSRGELSLREVRIGASPYWTPVPWLRIGADIGVVGSDAAVETKTTIFVNDAVFSSSSHKDDEWKIQGFTGVSAAFLPLDWLEIAVGAQARFPTRRVPFDDGIVSGSVELPKWDAFASVGICF